MTAAAGFGRRYGQLMLAGLALGMLAAAIGYFPTKRIGGPQAVDAMLAGCAVAVLAGWAGGAVCCRPGGTAGQRINRVLGATALRMAVAAGLAVATALAGWFPVRPLLLWVALAYLITLAGETLLVVRWLGEDSRTAAADRDGNGQ